MADRSKLDVARMRHVREIKLQWDSNKSDYNPLVNTSVLAHRYVLLNMFGKGGFAEVRCSFNPVWLARMITFVDACSLALSRCLQVFRAYDIESGSEVALKIHTVDSKVFSGAAQKEYVRRAIREVAILEGVRHQCVVRLHHVFQISDTSFAIVMEACKGLPQYVSEKKKCKMHSLWQQLHLGVSAQGGTCRLTFKSGPTDRYPNVKLAP